MQQKTLNNRYELEHKIGEGGMARVYRGRDLRLNRRVAIKVLHSHYASDANFLQRFHHEAQAAANLRHPHIVDVYDVGQDGDIHDIVMEYVEGSELNSQLLGGEPLPIDQAVNIAIAAAQGLDAAHRIGMIHRDVKPQNIIVGPGGQVKITDFGIAKSKLSTAMTETGVTFGTADYISPEQTRGQPATPASDIYSLGVTLYEMLTGRLPFTGESSIAVAMQHVTAEPPLPRMYNPRIPPQLEALVLRALSKDPAGRPASAREFARLLQTYAQLGEQETMVRPVVPRPAPHAVPQPAPRPAPRPTARPVPQTGATVRTTLPPPRPAVIDQPPPSTRGMGFGGFVLGLLLLGGVLGIVYLFAIGMFNDLLNFTAGARPQQPTTVIAEPTTTATPEPTAVPQVSVPNIVGLDEQSARAALEAARLSWQASPPRHSDTVSAGVVIDQLPLAGTTITETAVVTYAISLGPEIIEVPDVQRLRANDARQILERGGFQVQLQETPSTSVSEGFVISQEPFPGARVTRGETVTIVVSMGNKVIMPDVTGLTEEQAKQRIQEAGLVWSYSDYQNRDKLGELFDRVAPGTVVSSEPRGGTRVERGTPVTLGVRAP